MEPEVLGRVLVVDDELDLAEHLQQSLTRQQYDVATTSSTDALSLLAKENIDLLLSDMMMPDMDGIQLLQEALTLDPQLVGIIMTGQATVLGIIEVAEGGKLFIDEVAEIAWHPVPGRCGGLLQARKLGRTAGQSRSDGTPARSRRAATLQFQTRCTRQKRSESVGDRFFG